MLLRVSRRCLVSVVLGLALASWWSSSAVASADGGRSIAGAPVVVYGQQEFGNTATGGVDTSCNYNSYWSLPATAGDRVTMDWEIQGIRIALLIYPPDTNDFNVGQARPLQAQYLYGSGSRDELVFSSPVSGNLPTAFQTATDCLTSNETGPYDFTTYVQHVVRLSLSRFSRLRNHAGVRVFAHTADGGSISDPNLHVDVQIRSGRHPWQTIGTAAVRNAVAAVSLTIPRRFQGEKVALRATAHGGSYLTATTGTRRVLVLARKPKPSGRRTAGK